MHTHVRLATLADLPYIDTLRKREGNALGFIPQARYRAILLNKKPSERLYVTVDNGDLTGFAYVSFARDPAKIHQIAIQTDARRWHRALLLLDRIERRANHLRKSSLTCRVAVDLEANHFWQAAGFTPQMILNSTHHARGQSQSQRELIYYAKPLIATERQKTWEKSQNSGSRGLQSVAD